MPPAARDVLGKYGHGHVSSIQLRRAPLPGLSTIGNLATLGQWDNKLRGLNVDEFFHLSAVVRLDSGVTLLIEKNQLVNVEVFNGHADKGTQYVNVPGNNIRLLDAFRHMEIRLGARDLYKYDVQTANCQDFMVAFVQAAGVPSSNTIAWIKQPVEQLVRGMPSFVAPAVKGMTNLAAKLQYLWQQLTRE
jgi:hypothetical protein